MNFKSGDGPFAKIAHIALYVSRYKHLIRIWYLGTSRGAPISISGGRRSFHWPATRNSYSCLPSAARRHPRNLSRSSRSIWKMLKMRPDLWFFSAVIKHSTDLGQRTFFFFFFSGNLLAHWSVFETFHGWMGLNRTIFGRSSSLFRESSFSANVLS